jgi:hypothetical protein
MTLIRSLGRPIVPPLVADPPGFPWDRGVGGGAPEVPFPTLTAERGRFLSDAGVTLVGSDVSAWADQSGIGNHLTDGGSAARRPLFVASDAGFGGKPVLHFDGVAEWLSKAAFSWGGVTTTYTWWFVVKTISLSNLKYLGQYNAASPYFPGSATGHQSMNDNGALSTTTTDLTAAAKLFCGVKGGGTQRLYVGTALEDSDANATVGEADGGALGLMATSGGAGFMEAKLAAFGVMRSAITADELAALKAWASWKYGV